MLNSQLGLISVMKKKPNNPPDELKLKPTDRACTDGNTHAQTSGRQDSAHEGGAKHIPSPTFEALATASRARSAASDAPLAVWPAVSSPPPPPHLSRSSLLAKSASFGSCETTGRWRRQQSDKRETVLLELPAPPRLALAASAATRWLSLLVDAFDARSGLTGVL